MKTKQPRKPRKKRYKTGEYTSLKTGKTHKYRSGWEASYMRHLDNDPAVLTWGYECVVVPYGGRTGMVKKYFPDFLVEYATGNVLVEIKPSRKVNQKRNQKKFEAAERWCREHNATLRVITEVELKELELL